MEERRKRIPVQVRLAAAWLILIGGWSLLRSVGETATSDRFLIPIAAIGLPGAVAMLCGKNWGRNWTALCLIALAGANLAISVAISSPVPSLVAFSMAAIPMGLFFVIWNREVTAFFKAKADSTE